MKYYFTLVIVLLYSSQASAYGHRFDLRTDDPRWITYEIVHNNSVSFCVKSDSGIQIKDEQNIQAVVIGALDHWLTRVDKAVYIIDKTDNTLKPLSNIKINYIKLDNCTDKQLKIFLTNDPSSYCHIKAVSCFEGKDMTLYIRPYHVKKDSTNLLHELGHAFGLCDQYTDADAEPLLKAEGLLKCDPLHSSAVQPYGIMNMLTDIDYDDTEGLIRLFDRFSSNTPKDKESIQKIGSYNRVYIPALYKSIYKGAGKRITYKNGQLVQQVYYHNIEKPEDAIVNYDYSPDLRSLSIEAIKIDYKNTTPTTQKISKYIQETRNYELTDLRYTPIQEGGTPCDELFEYTTDCAKLFKYSKISSKQDKMKKEKIMSVLINIDEENKRFYIDK